MYYGAFAVSISKEMEFMSNTKKEIEIKDKEHLEVTALETLLPSKQLPAQSQQ